MRAELAGLTDRAGDTTQAMQMAGAGEQSKGTLEWLLQGQSVMVATNKIFMIIAVLFFVAAFAIWLAPRPKTQVDTSVVP